MKLKKEKRVCSSGVAAFLFFFINGGSSERDRNKMGLSNSKYVLQNNRINTHRQLREQV